MIGLDRTGRNPEVEEVFGALALLLNGGGVGQLKTIVSELNNAFAGREGEVRSVLDQIRTLHGPARPEQGRRSSRRSRTPTGSPPSCASRTRTIKSALDDVPATRCASVNRQRADLVKLLKALTRLSGVGVRVIQASKESTINSLRELAPVLDGFAKAGENFPKSFQVFLTYPFVDEAVGRDPQVARNLHMGDYTNLSVNLDVNLADLNLPDIPPITDPRPQLCDAVEDGSPPGPTSGLRRSRASPTAQQKAIDEVGARPRSRTTTATITLNTVRKYIAAALLTRSATRRHRGLCARQAGNRVLCKPARPIPTALPTMTLGRSRPAAPVAWVGDLLPRAQLGERLPDAAEHRPVPPAPLGLDPGVGTHALPGGG